MHANDAQYGIGKHLMTYDEILHYSAGETENEKRLKTITYYKPFYEILNMPAMPS